MICSVSEGDRDFMVIVVVFKCLFVVVWCMLNFLICDMSHIQGPVTSVLPFHQWYWFENKWCQTGSGEIPPKIVQYVCWYLCHNHETANTGKRGSTAFWQVFIHEFKPSTWLAIYDSFQNCKTWEPFWKALYMTLYQQNFIHWWRIILILLPWWVICIYGLLFGSS